METLPQFEVIRQNRIRRYVRTLGRITGIVAPEVPLHMSNHYRPPIEPAPIVEPKPVLSPADLYRVDL